MSSTTDVHIAWSPSLTAQTENGPGLSVIVKEMYRSLQSVFDTKNEPRMHILCGEKLLHLSDTKRRQEKALSAALEESISQDIHALNQTVSQEDDKGMDLTEGDVAMFLRCSSLLREMKKLYGEQLPSSEDGGGTTPREPPQGLRRNRWLFFVTPGIKEGSKTGTEMLALSCALRYLEATYALKCVVVGVEDDEPDAATEQGKAAAAFTPRQRDSKASTLLATNATMMNIDSGDVTGEEEEPSLLQRLGENSSELDMTWPSREKASFKRTCMWSQWGHWLDQNAWRCDRTLLSECAVVLPCGGALSDAFCDVVVPGVELWVRRRALTDMGSTRGNPTRTGIPHFLAAAAVERDSIIGGAEEGLFQKYPSGSSFASSGGGTQLVYCADLTAWEVPHHALGERIHFEVTSGDENAACNLPLVEALMRCGCIGDSVGCSSRQKSLKTTMAITSNNEEKTAHRGGAGLFILRTAVCSKSAAGSGLDASSSMCFVLISLDSCSKGLDAFFVRGDSAEFNAACRSLAYGSLPLIEAVDRLHRQLHSGAESRTDLTASGNDIDDEDERARKQVESWLFSEAYTTNGWGAALDRSSENELSDLDRACFGDLSSYVKTPPSRRGGSGMDETNTADAVMLPVDGNGPDTEVLMTGSELSPEPVIDPMSFTSTQSTTKKGGGSPNNSSSLSTRPEGPVDSWEWRRLDMDTFSRDAAVCKDDLEQLTERRAPRREKTRPEQETRVMEILLGSEKVRRRRERKRLRQKEKQQQQEESVGAGISTGSLRDSSSSALSRRTDDPLKRQILASIAMAHGSLKPPPAKRPLLPPTNHLSLVSMFELKRGESRAQSRNRKQLKVQSDCFLFKRYRSTVPFSSESGTSWKKLCSERKRREADGYVPGVEFASHAEHSGKGVDKLLRDIHSVSLIRESGSHLAKVPSTPMHRSNSNVLSVGARFSNRQSSESLREAAARSLSNLSTGTMPTTPQPVVTAAPHSDYQTPTSSVGGGASSFLPLSSHQSPFASPLARACSPFAYVDHLLASNSITSSPFLNEIRRGVGIGGAHPAGGADPNGGSVSRSGTPVFPTTFSHTSGSSAFPQRLKPPLVPSSDVLRHGPQLVPPVHTPSANCAFVIGQSPMAAIHGTDSPLLHTAVDVERATSLADKAEESDRGRAKKSSSRRAGAKKKSKAAAVLSMSSLTTGRCGRSRRHELLRENVSRLASSQGMISNAQGMDDGTGSADNGAKEGLKKEVKTAGEKGTTAGPKAQAGGCAEVSSADKEKELSRKNKATLWSCCREVMRSHSVSHHDRFQDIRKVTFKHMLATVRASSLFRYYDEVLRRSHLLEFTKLCLAESISRAGKDLNIDLSFQ